MMGFAAQNKLELQKLLLMLSEDEKGYEAAVITIEDDSEHSIINEVVDLDDASKPASTIDHIIKRHLAVEETPRVSMDSSFDVVADRKDHFPMPSYAKQSITHPKNDSKDKSQKSKTFDPRRFHPTNTVYIHPRGKASLPPNSRLFIGNLPSEKTSLDEIASIFAKYGNIEEITLKETYGFVQFATADACRKAIKAENHRELGNLRLELDVANDKTGDRSRGRFRDDITRGRRDSRDDSPNRRRRRSRSRDIPRYGSHRRRSFGEHSPVSRNRDSCSLRRRDSSPSRPFDCQVIVLGEVSKRSIREAEEELRDAGVTAMSTMYITPRTDLANVVRDIKSKGSARSILFLESRRLECGKVAVQLFKPDSEVEELDSISLFDAAEMVKKNSKAAKNRRNSDADVIFVSSTPGTKGKATSGVAQQGDAAALIAQMLVEKSQQGDAIAALIAQAQAQGIALDSQSLLTLISLANSQQLAANMQQGLAPPVSPQAQMSQQGMMFPNTIPQAAVTQQLTHGMSPLVVPTNQLAPTMQLAAASPNVFNSHLGLTQMGHVQGASIVGQSNQGSVSALTHNIADMLNQFNSGAKLLQAINNMKH